MSLSLASTVARRGRHPKALRPVALDSPGSASAAYGNRQQTRGYKFGRLSSYLEYYIRHPSHRCRDDSSRRRFWDKHSLAEDAKSTLQRVVYNYWSPGRGDRFGGWRCLNTDAGPGRTPDNPTGVRPGQNIEDAERGPLEHFLFGDAKSQSGKNAGRSGQEDANADYVIDPITNRKVPRKRAPPKAQKPPFVNRSGTANGVFLDALNLEHKEVRWHRNDTIASARSMAASWSRSSESPQYPDLHRYKAFRYREPDGKPADEEPAKKPEDLAKYGPVRVHEPDGKYKAESAAPEKPRELHKYGPVKVHEPDGKYKTESEAVVEPQERDHRGIIESLQAETKADERPESAVNPEELAKYGAVRSHEPDGKYKLESESSVDPAELSQYGAVRSHEPDGKYKAEPECSVDPEELKRYGAVRSHEPDGKYKLEAEGTPVEPEELAKYGAVRSHEPDGKYKAAATSIDTPSEAELAAYRKPVLAHEPDGLYAANHAQPEYDAEDLARYRQPFYSHEPDGMYAASYVEPSPEEIELSKYGAFRSHEPDGKYAASYVEEKPDPTELATYGPVRSHEPDGLYALRNNVSAFPAEAQRYQAFRSHEPDGKYALEAQEAREAQDLANHEAFTYEDAEIRHWPQSQPSKNPPDVEGYETLRHHQASAPAEANSAHEDYESEEQRKYQAVPWSEPDGKPIEADGSSQTLPENTTNGDSRKQEQTPFRRKVEELMAQAAAESDGLEADNQAAQQANLNNNRDDRPRALTGNYTRDFPEEFSKSWASELPQAFPSLLTAEQRSSEGAIQPALDRHNSKASEDARSASALPADRASPVLYKVLVYDPATESVRTAETASTVPETTAPPTPAEILLRLANPARFLPHFAPLQAQGFEMVSGGGDVLVFRKMRHAADDDAPAPAGAGAGAVPGKAKRSLPRKVAVGAACLAGSAYSVGVVSEYFRSGGVDGTGPKGL
ncbi:hypothetical protein VTH06DRAFT_286 [Thermothelomyces fergusii]